MVPRIISAYDVLSAQVSFLGGARGFPVVPARDPASGLLPLGRHVCSESEVEAAFVSAAEFAASPTRADIWRDWQQGVRLLRTAVTVHAAWLGGSFTTSKVDPADLDVTFVINGADMRTRSLPEQKIITLFGTSQVKAALGLQLDSYAVPWESIPQPQNAGLNGFGDPYYWARGHWDDWWQRRRLSPRTTPPGPADTSPRRGYLEVPFSDYP